MRKLLVQKCTHDKRKIIFTQYQLMSITAMTNFSFFFDSSIESKNFINSIVCLNGRKFYASMALHFQQKANKICQLRTNCVRRQQTKKEIQWQTKITPSQTKLYSTKKKMNEGKAKSK